MEPNAASFVVLSYWVGPEILTLRSSPAQLDGAPLVKSKYESKVHPLGLQSEWPLVIESILTCAALPPVCNHKFLQTMQGCQLNCPSNFFWWFLDDKKQSWVKFGSWFYENSFVYIGHVDLTSRPFLLTLKCGLSSLKERSWTLKIIKIYNNI